LASIYLVLQAIPDLSAAPRDEFIVDVNLPTGYDPAARLCGAVRVEVSTLAELEANLARGRTAFVLLMADRYDPAPTWLTLEQVAPLAEAAGVPVSMGYNKNVTKYVAEARAVEATAGDGASTKFIHNNAYAPEELDECFQRNAEGMLKNMAVHELALAVTYYGVTAENIASVVADKDYSVCEERVGFTDFAKVAFTITTTGGKTVTIQADR
jgi:hypothetical protein